MILKPVLARFALMALALATSGIAHAHDGHVNTPWHAFLHMIEHNGVPLLIAFVVIVGVLLSRVRRQRATDRLRRGERHDSR